MPRRGPHAHIARGTCHTRSSGCKARKARGAAGPRGAGERAVAPVRARATRTVVDVGNNAAASGAQGTGTSVHGGPTRFAARQRARQPQGWACGATVGSAARAASSLQRQTAAHLRLRMLYLYCIFSRSSSMVNCGRAAPVRVSIKAQQTRRAGTRRPYLDHLGWTVTSHAEVAGSGARNNRRGKGARGGERKGRLPRQQLPNWLQRAKQRRSETRPCSVTLPMQ